MSVFGALQPIKPDSTPPLTAAFLLRRTPDARERRGPNGFGWSPIVLQSDRAVTVIRTISLVIDLDQNGRVAEPPKAA